MVKTGSYYFLSRPRRFGKSLLISTLEAYFQGKKELFEGLAMEKLEKDWIRYPVLHLDLNIEKYDTPESLDKILHDNLDAELHEFAEARGVSYDKLCDYLKAYYDGYHFTHHSIGMYNPFSLLNTAKKREEQKGKTVRVHNTNTAMGKALAAAMGGVSFDNSAETSTKKNAPAVQNASNDAKDISGLEKRIKNKKLLAEELGIGEITLTDILKELEKPGRDPRDDMPKPILRSDVLDMKDLKPGMILKGTVRNVIDFGVFVDIGVHQDGLVHISQITDRYIKHPLEAVSVGDIVDVQVLTVDVAKKRIGLTMKIQKQ